MKSKYSDSLKEIKDQLAIPRSGSICDSCIPLMIIGTFISELKECAEFGEVEEAETAKFYLKMYDDMEPLSQYCPDTRK